MKITPLKTDTEIQEYIRKHYGSVESYLSKRNDQQPLLTLMPAGVSKSTAEIFLDLCDAAGKSLGITRETFFHRRSVS